MTSFFEMCTDPESNTSILFFLFVEGYFSEVELASAVLLKNFLEIRSLIL